MRKFIYCLIAGSLLTISSTAQTVEVSGKVLDTSGAPIPNSTVLQKGVSKGTTADFDGKFTLKVPVGTTLVFNSIGYEKREVKITEATSSLLVKLNTTSTSLAEVVITGSGVATSKRKLG